MAYRSGKLLSTLIDFLRLRKQRVVLNGQLYLLSNIESGVPQRYSIGPLLFLIYINDLSEVLTTNVRLLADNVSIFSIVDNINLSTTNLSRGLKQNKCLGKSMENDFQS